MNLDAKDIDDGTKDSHKYHKSDKGGTLGLQDTSPTECIVTPVTPQTDSMQCVCSGTTTMPKKGFKTKNSLKKPLCKCCKGAETMRENHSIGSQEEMATLGIFSPEEICLREIKKECDMKNVDRVNKQGDSLEPSTEICTGLADGCDNDVECLDDMLVCSS